MTDVRGAVDEALAQFLAEKHTETSRVSAEIRPLMESLETFLQAGKRLRPIFMYWGVRAGGVNPELNSYDPWITACASLEWLHACALIHDDVMDASDTRRGRPAVHKQMQFMHEKQQWRQSSQRFGESAAVLLGDMCLIWCDEMLMRTELPPDVLARARTQYDTMRTELMVGQYLDVVGDAMDAVSTQRAQRVLQLKSGRYTVQRPLLIGAAAAGADTETLTALRVYGELVGEAFQLRDDVLGVFGDPARTGKPSGDDIREGKRSVLMLTALDAASESDASTLRRYLGNAELSEANLHHARGLLQDSGALEHVETRIKHCIYTACNEISVIADTEVCDSLRGLAHAAAAREG